MGWVLWKTWCWQAGDMFWLPNYYYFIIMIIMAIIIFIQGVSICISETNHVPTVYNVSLLVDYSALASFNVVVSVNLLIFKVLSVQLSVCPSPFSLLPVTVMQCKCRPACLQTAFWIYSVLGR